MTALDSTNRTAIAQMAINNIQFFNRLVQHFCSLQADIVVAGAVHTITTDTVLFIQLIRQRIQVRLFWHSLMISRIKYSNIR